MKRKQYKVSEAQIPMFDFDHPHMPVLDVSRCEARLINYETAARMVETYHYAHRVPSIVVAVGMFVDGILAGCLTYGIPPSHQLCEAFGESGNVLELNRLFVFDWVRRNGESWLIGQSFQKVPNPYNILVSYADISQSHIGYIYQATNWLYTGLGNTGGSGSREKIINGQRMHAKAINNTYGTIKKDDLYNLGLEVQEIEKSFKHRYVYFLGNKRQRRELRKALKWPVLPYPKGK